MTYNVLLENEEKNQYKATVLGWSDCTARGNTRQEALNQLRQVIINRLARVEIIPIDIDEPIKEHPWLKFDGVFKNNPLFDEVIDEIKAYRAELEKDETII